MLLSFIAPKLLRHSSPLPSRFLIWKHPTRIKANVVSLRYFFALLLAGSGDILTFLFFRRRLLLSSFGVVDVCLLVGALVTSQSSNSTNALRSGGINWRGNAELDSTVLKTLFSLSRISRSLVSSSSSCMWIFHIFYRELFFTAKKCSHIFFAFSVLYSCRTVRLSVDGWTCSVTVEYFKLSSELSYESEFANILSEKLFTR